jgi:hypothetical protein
MLWHSKSPSHPLITQGGDFKSQNHAIKGGGSRLAPWVEVLERGAGGVEVRGRGDVSRREVDGIGIASNTCVYRSSFWDPRSPSPDTRDTKGGRRAQKFRPSPGRMTRSHMTRTQSPTNRHERQNAKQRLALTAPNRLLQPVLVLVGCRRNSDMPTCTTPSSRALVNPPISDAPF